MDIVSPSAPTEDDGPPPYTTLPPGVDLAILSRWASGDDIVPDTGPAPSIRLRGGRYGYMDFIPRIARKRVFQHNQYETFPTLLLRANTWLEEHSGVTVVRCETVTWSCRQVKDVFTDSCVFERSMNAATNTRFVVGLRLWYHMEMMDSPVRHAPASTHVIKCRTFLPKVKERFHQLVNRVNKILQQEATEGRVLSMEMVNHSCMKDNTYRPKRMNANGAVYKDNPSRTKKYVFSLRVFILLTSSAGSRETLGYQDFVPEHDGRNKENKGYELFSDVMLRASRWVASQRGVRFTNIQTIKVKIKRKSEYPERCVYSEHRCAHNRLNCLAGANRVTHYLNVVRVFYAVGPVASEAPATRLTYRTFTPVQCTRATAASPAEYEPTRQLMERVNHWLQITGANVFSVETVRVQMTKGGLQLLGTEATYAQNSIPTARVQRFLYQIRIYLDGEYFESPQAVCIVLPTQVS